MRRYGGIDIGETNYTEWGFGWVRGEYKEGGRGEGLESLEAGGEMFRYDTGEMGRDISLLIDERELFYKNFKGRLLEVYLCLMLTKYLSLLSVSLSSYLGIWVKYSTCSLQ